MFVKILTANDKYSLLNRYNFRQPIQINTVQILTGPPLLYLLITAKTIKLEKISLSDMQSFGNIC